MTFTITYFWRINVSIQENVEFYKMARHTSALLHYNAQVCRATVCNIHVYVHASFNFFNSCIITRITIKMYIISGKIVDWSFLSDVYNNIHGCKSDTLWINRKLSTCYTMLIFHTCPISSRLCSIDCIGETRVVQSRPVKGTEVTWASVRTPWGSRGIHQHRARIGEQHSPQNSKCHGGLKLKVY